jgi:glycosyltransferase involved in cell wall biosynthesis
MNISNFYRTDGLLADDVEIVVTLPTFKRPEQVLLTLASLASQSTEKAYAVIVMDNHEDAEGAAAAAKYMNDNNLNGIVIIAHDRGNCHAYNAGWATALKEFPNFKFLAVIDDDEVADKDWLRNHLRTLEDTGCDIVGGPQLQQFHENAADVWKRHPVFEPHYKITGPVPILYSSGNVVIKRHILDAMPQPFLEPKFNFIGGGDSDFYRRCQTKGFTFAWCNEAPVLEDVPERRSTFRWVNARSYRNGAISAIIETRISNNRTKTIAKSLLLLGASPFRSLKSAIEHRSVIIGLYHMQIAVGRILAEFGIINEQYRNPEAN